MNIFYLSEDVDECARWHVDRHVVKMMTEYTQLLCTAHRILDGSEYSGLSLNGRRTKRWRLEDANTETVLYSATHINHPSAVWARKSRENYIWLYSMFVALTMEYSHRYGKVYKAFRKEEFPNTPSLGELLATPPKNGPTIGVTPILLAMADEYKIPGGTAIESYRNYYINGKKHLHKWSKRSTPNWII